MRCVSVQENVSRGDEIVTAVRQFVFVDGQTVISGCWSESTSSYLNYQSWRSVSLFSLKSSTALRWTIGKYQFYLSSTLSLALAIDLHCRLLHKVIPWKVPALALGYLLWETAVRYGVGGSLFLPTYRRYYLSNFYSCLWLYALGSFEP